MTRERTLVDELADPGKWPSNLSPVEVLDLFASWAQRIVEDRPAAPSVEEGPRPFDDTWVCARCGHTGWTLRPGHYLACTPDTCVAPSPEAPARCPECDGLGEIEIIETVDGCSYRAGDECPRCNGTGTKEGGKP